MSQDQVKKIVYSMMVQQEKIPELKLVQVDELERKDIISIHVNCG